MSTFEVNIISKILKCCIYLINNYSNIIDAFVSDVFVKSHYETLPNDWKNYFYNMSPDDVNNIFHLKKFSSSRKVPPLSFLSFISLCDFVDLNSENKKYLKQFDRTNITTNNRKNNNLSVSDLQRHLSPKKQHEVECLSKLINFINDESVVKYHVVDIGGGQGHLARYLSMFYNIPVTCIEGSKHNSDKATEFDEKLILKNQKTNEQVDIIKPLHKTIYLNRNINSDWWNSVMEDDQNEKSQYLLNGLHCCGELAPTMIDMFCRLSNCTAMVLTSCCYHKMKADSQPMSSICKTLMAERNLTYVTLESACHFLFEYKEKLKLAAKQNSSIVFESQIFRATLQEIVSNRQMTNKICRNKLKTKKYPIEYSTEHRFNLYCCDLFKKCDIFPFDLTSKEKDLAFQRIENDWKQVVIFHCLRLTIGPAVETLLLLDRMLYLKENNIEASIYQIFDPSLSPRNSAIVARKNIT